MDLSQGIWWNAHLRGENDMKTPQITLILLVGLLGAHTAFAWDLREDPYQNAAEDRTLKRYFLNRLANTDDVYPGPDPEFKFTKDDRYHRYMQYGWTEGSGRSRGWIVASNTIGSLSGTYYNPDTSKHTKGAVYVTRNASELAPLFEKVAKKIKTRLVK